MICLNIVIYLSLSLWGIISILILSSIIIQNFNNIIIKIYICKKCETFHNKFFKRHKLYGLNNDINNIFTGFCQKNNHLEKTWIFL
jgi:hypothetical protein